MGPKLNNGFEIATIDHYIRKALSFVVLIVLTYNIMTFSEYILYFQDIVAKGLEEQGSPYNNPDYLDYTKMNWHRMNRWLKTGILSEELAGKVKSIHQPQEWLLITEPWCGDAAHSVPFIELLSRLNPLITLNYELRDSEPYSINSYLTRGSKSIPKLVIRNAEGEDLGTWGPRPEGCQVIYDTLMAEKAPFDKVKEEIQNWYNGNKGVAIQQELDDLFTLISGGSR